jgi:hypothetical protein
MNSIVRLEVGPTRPVKPPDADQSLPDGSA